MRDWSLFSLCSVTPPLKQNRGEEVHRLTVVLLLSMPQPYLALQASCIAVAFTHSCFTKDLIFILLLIIYVWLLSFKTIDSTNSDLGLARRPLFSRKAKDSKSEDFIVGCGGHRRSLRLCS